MGFHRHLVEQLGQVPLVDTIGSAKWSGTQEDGFDAYVGYAHFLRCVISE